MSDDYTPTTEQVRDAYMEGTRSFWHPIPGPEFDRWLVAHDAEVRADQQEQDAQIAADKFEVEPGWHDYYRAAGKGIAASIRTGGAS